MFAITRHSKAARHFCRQASTSIQRVTIVGSGIMGSGIAQVAAQSGNQVTVVDLDRRALSKSQKTIEKSLHRIAKKEFENDPSAIDSFLSKVLKNITFITDVEESLEKTDLVIECIIEQLSAKQSLFETINRAVDDEVIVASNTSSFLISEVADPVDTKERVVGLHFFNPVPMLKLVEVVRVPETSDHTYNQVIAWTKSLGKVPVTAKDKPGFIVNRIIVPFTAEAVRMLERGDATAEDIDTAFKLGCGHPLGPLQLMDLAGLDTFRFIIENFNDKFPEDTVFRPIPTLDRLVQEKKLGMKSGQGFHTYEKKSK